MRLLEWLRAPSIAGTVAQRWHGQHARVLDRKLAAGDHVCKYDHLLVVSDDPEDEIPLVLTARYDGWIRWMYGGPTISSGTTYVLIEPDNWRFPPTLEVPTRSTTLEVPTHSTTLEVPTRPTTLEVPTHSTTLEVPTRPTTLEVPTRPTTLEVPTRPTTLEVPTRPTTLEVPTPCYPADDDSKSKSYKQRLGEIEFVKDKAAELDALLAGHAPGAQSIYGAHIISMLLYYAARFDDQEWASLAREWARWAGMPLAAKAGQDPAPAPTKAA